MDDPDDQEAWQTFFVGVFEDNVWLRCLLPDDVPAAGCSPAC